MRNNRRTTAVAITTPHPRSLSLKDLVLPMILSSLTMNIILYEKDYDLNDIPKSNSRIREAFLPRAIHPPIFCGRSTLFTVTVMFCWFVPMQRTLGSTGSLRSSAHTRISNSFLSIECGCKPRAPDRMRCNDLLQ